MAERTYLDTKIVGYDESGSAAYAKIRMKEGIWVKICLDRKSLDSLDLKLDDTFKWKPQEDGIIRPEHILDHPRRDNPGEYEENQNFWKRFKEFAKSSGWIK